MRVDDDAYDALAEHEADKRRKAKAAATIPYGQKFTDEQDRSMGIYADGPK